MPYQKIPKDRLCVVSIGGNRNNKTLNANYEPIVFNI